MHLVVGKYFAIFKILLKNLVNIWLFSGPC